MKTSIHLPALLLALAVFFLGNGCIAIGNRDAPRPKATLGQQLIDLQKARDTGALTDAEYQTQKAKLLESR